MSPPQELRAPGSPALGPAMSGGVAQVMNLPNALTAGRLAVVPAFALLLLVGESAAASWAAAGLFALACLTDVLDGYLARSRGQVTNFGIMADPIADKALIGSALVGLSLTGALPWWATGVILAREIGVTVMRSMLARHGMMPANRGGKLKSLAQNLAVCAYLVPLSQVEGARLPLLVCAVLATVYTGAVYARQGVLMQRRAEAELRQSRATGEPGEHPTGEH